MPEKILIIDCGSQYTQLIARRVRELNVYCEIQSFNKKIERSDVLKGVIISGSPASVNNDNAPKIPLQDLQGVPILAICYGAQYFIKDRGGNVVKSDKREYGSVQLSNVNTDNLLFRDINPYTNVWMSHSDTIERLPKDCKIIAATDNIKCAAFEIPTKSIYGLQFHPEVFHTEEGEKIIDNFLTHVCKCKKDWTSESFIYTALKKIKDQVKDDKVLLGLSGGVDSTVAAVLINKAIGKRLICVFVDNGLLRKNEFENIMQSYKQLELNVIGIKAGDCFLTALKGVSEPEEKRKIIGKKFIDVFEEEARKVKGVKWLAQGTIYPDIIESVSINGPSVTIKSHHNVGGLPDQMNLKILEPLKLLFKDGVRKIGKSLHIDKQFLNRHPFPGPGLSIRIIGEITPEKIDTLQEADDIFIRSLQQENLYDEVWQAATILLPIKSVGVMGDERTYENVIALRAVSSTDGMTADWVHFSHKFLASVSNKIINNVKGVNRVVYDISSKPPATIEWE